MKTFIRYEGLPGPISLLWGDDDEPDGGFWRETREPGADLSDLPEEVRAEIEAVWTPEVIEAWAAQKAALDDLPEAGAPEVPDEISRRQFAEALALDGTITKREAVAYAARGDLPTALEAALAQIPEEGDQRFSAEIRVVSTIFRRSDPLVSVLGPLLDHDGPALDALWARAAAL